MRNQINYKNIDIDCREMVKFFNGIGLETQYSCSGHGKEYYMINFKYDLEDKLMIDFIKQFKNKYNHSSILGKFVKWNRIISGELVENWLYISENIERANYDLALMQRKYNTWGYVI